MTRDRVHQAYLDRVDRWVADVQEALNFIGMRVGAGAEPAWLKSRRVLDPNSNRGRGWQLPSAFAGETRKLAKLMRYEYGPFPIKPLLRTRKLLLKLPPYSGDWTREHYVKIQDFFKMALPVLDLLRAAIDPSIDPPPAFMRIEQIRQHYGLSVAESELVRKNLEYWRETNEDLCQRGEEMSPVSGRARWLYPMDAIEPIARRVIAKRGQQ